MDRFALGWNPDWDHLLEKHDPDLLIRITQRNRDQYEAITAYGASLRCVASGSLVRSSEETGEFPVAGDWCVLRTRQQQGDQPVIEELLPRSSCVSRINAGRTSYEQALAANVDYLFVTTSANRDFNVNRLRRYVLTAVSGNCTPVIVLTKADLPDADIDEIKAAIFEAFSDMLCFETSAIQGIGLHRIESLLKQGATGVFIGSSGVGKSTLVNALLQSEVQRTSSIRDQDARGRHTTSVSGLFFLPSGGIIIDTPGLREIAVVADDDALHTAMPTVSLFAADCRFANCTHTVEPGCRVREALTEGELSEEEFDAYEKLERELAFSRRKVDQRLESAQRRMWKQRTKDMRVKMKDKRGDW